MINNVSKTHLNTSLAEMFGVLDEVAADSILTLNKWINCQIDII